VLVVAGQGPDVEHAGGHTKIGELIGRATYAAVVRALGLGAGLTPHRSILHRLAERRIDLFSVVSSVDLGKASLGTRKRVFRKMQAFLLAGPATGLMQAALALADQSLSPVTLAAFAKWCRQTAAALVQQPDLEVNHRVRGGLPEPVRLALDALLEGALHEVTMATASHADR
jgi:hypothetical protein